MNGFDFRTWINSLSEEELHHLDIAYKFKELETNPTQPAPVQKERKPACFSRVSCKPLNLTSSNEKCCPDAGLCGTCDYNRECGYLSEDQREYYTFLEYLDFDFQEDERPLLTAVFDGNLKLLLDNSKYKAQAYKALCDYLDLEFGIEDLVGFEYDKRRNTTKVSYLGS